MHVGVASREVTRNLEERGQEAAQHQAEAQRAEAARAALASELEAAQAAIAAAGVHIKACCVAWLPSRCCLERCGG